MQTYEIDITELWY